MAQFWWVVYPYVTLTLMVAGCLYRFTHRPFGWGSQSSEMLEKRSLRWGSLLFHWGIIFVFIGHVMGLLIPMALYRLFGISDEFYHFNAILFGSIVGIIAWLGAVILLLRRFFQPRIRANSHRSDFVSLDMLILVITLGVAVTLVYDVFYDRYEYRATIGPWIRQVLTFHPDASLMAHVPLILQIHIIAAFALFAIWPFTRLVHVFSYPVRYFRRAPIQYRSRTRYKKSPDRLT